MTQKQLECHKGPVWVYHTAENAIPITNWRLIPCKGRILLEGLLALTEQVYPSEQACLESLIECQMAAIRIASERISRIEARISKLNSGVDKGI